MNKMYFFMLLLLICNVINSSFCMESGDSIASTEEIREFFWWRRDTAELYALAEKHSKTDLSGYDEKGHTIFTRQFQRPWWWNTKDEDIKNFYEALLTHLSISKQMKDLVNKADKWEQAPLQLAARNGYHETVKLLLAHNADPNSIEGRPPLLFAAMHGRHAIVQTLLAHNADPTIPTSTEKTILDYAKDEKIILALKAAGALE